MVRAGVSGRTRHWRPRSRADAQRAYENARAAGSPWGEAGLGMLAQAGAGAPHLAREAVTRYEAFLAASPPEAGWPLYAQDVTTRLAWLHAENPAVRDAGRALALLAPHSGFIRGHLIESSGGDPVDAAEAYIDAAYLYDYGYPDEREREADHRLARLFLSGALGPCDPMAAIALLETSWPRPRTRMPGSSSRGDYDRPRSCST